MKYTCTLLAVKDMEKSLAFYKEFFNQDVVLDLGANKTLSCGLVLQAQFEKLLEISAEKMIFSPHNMEIYFETEDFDDFLNLLNGHSEVKKLHEARTFEWLQRGIRIFDPDGHIIEVSESMFSVACRQFEAGKNAEETAGLIMHPKELVQGWFETWQKNISVCGTKCSECGCFGNMCKGCNAHHGKVFHAPEGRACPIYDCCKNAKGKNHCGECKNAPCAIWRSTRDPSFSDEQFEKSIADRVETLKTL